ncbi:antibiotic biosynthesis monooxygenase family protein [Arundinibacter roseus]|uniref:Antibiotic biosynthesis monooxygenase n=1 Tax=Arundinibacter roseus TaxID=2070510 RepID=A0A4R4KFY8_9BACT|nr:antibiotic biosynthesis monooxygenase [Arundinibacter roseus]TDB66868.1 antibiotic biosynthesis monooxygenase [Arundinibacter roseus]
MHLATTPPPPYYAVIFTSVRSDIIEGYAETAQRMEELAKQQPGYLGHEAAREQIGVTVSYWESLEAIRNWKTNTEHILAQQTGRSDWYTAYTTRICLVERAYSWGDFNL